MPRKQRHFVYEMVAILAALFFGVFTVPTLINAHDSIALMCVFGGFTPPNIPDSFFLGFKT